MVVVLVASNVASPPTYAGDAPRVHFDLPPLVAASPSDVDPTDPTLVTIQLRLSALVHSSGDDQVDQWIVQCQPRDRESFVVDYAPRTKTASDVAGEIQVKETAEENHLLGLSLDASYGHAVRGTFGADRGIKNSSTREFERLAAEQAVTASGTINRGRGVYFKLRWTAKQVLEGEKTFSMTLRVPPSWRGGLVDVSVIAQTQRKTFGGWDSETKTIGSADFVVAAFRQGDAEAHRRAVELCAAEDALRVAARKQSVPTAVKSLPSMIRSVAIKLDLEPKHVNPHWLRELLLGNADPHLHKDIRQLDMPVRIVVLDYADRRDEFVALNRDPAQRDPAQRDPAQRVVAAKPIVDATHRAAISN